MQVETSRQNTSLPWCLTSTKMRGQSIAEISVLQSFGTRLAQRRTTRANVRTTEVHAGGLVPNLLRKSGVLASLLALVMVIRNVLPSPGSYGSPVFSEFEM